MIEVEVVYALPHKQIKVTVTLSEGQSALDALRLSNLQSQLPETDLLQLEMGIYSRLLDGRSSPLPADYVMRDGDRLELYRPLQLDPNKARLLRAARKKKRK
jgi:putative ubiquitin-RnfH superfamily antitoxin RatB of RatAB toxin-antitoxin module